MSQSATLADAIPIDRNTDIVQQRCGAHAWQVLTGYQRLILGPAAPNWAALGEHPGAVCIKSNRHRQVWRVQHDGQLIYVKVFAHATTAHRLKRLWRGSAASREWMAGVYAAEIGLPSVMPLAYAQPIGALSNNVCILITKGLHQVAPLDEYWPTMQNDWHAVVALTDKLAATIARAHQGGFEHFDLHVGNLLVQEDADANIRVLIVDLQSVRLGRPIHDAAIVKNLAQLNQWFRRHASVPQRVRFLERYLAWRDALAMQLPHATQLSHDVRTLVRMLDDAAAVHADALWSKRDRRALRHGKYFGRVKLGDGWRGHVFLEAKHTVKGAPSSALQFDVGDWRKWLKPIVAPAFLTGDTGIIKQSHTARVRRLTLDESLHGLDVICKQAKPRTFWHALKSLVRPSRDFRSWQRGHALLNRDLPTARPLAVVERKLLGLHISSLVLTEVIPDSRDLDRLCTEELPRLSPAQQRAVKDELVRVLVRLIRRMHERGFVHRDFKASNILITGDTSAAQLAAWLIDLDGLRRVQKVGGRDRLRVMMRLGVSLDYCPWITQSDRLRFLKAMLIGYGRTDRGWKDVWREIQTWSDQKRELKAARTRWKMKHYGRP